jgi:alanine-synthesizing transaminase
MSTDRFPAGVLFRTIESNVFSSRFHWDTRPNRLTRLLAEKRASGRHVLDLTQSNPTRAGLSYDPSIPATLAAPEGLEYDPSPAGSPAAREAVSAYYAARGIAAEPGRILMTASTSEGYAYLFKLLCDPGAEVLVPRPSYPLFEFLATMESVSVRQYPLAYHGRWSIDIDHLAHEVTARTRAVVVVNPNNPTGSYLKQDELEAIARLCRDRGMALISDEVFSDYDFAPDSRRARTVSAVGDCLAFAMSGLSKVAGLPQMKLGWIVAAGPDSLREDAVAKLEWIADTYLSVSTPVQCAAAALIRAGRQVQQQIRVRTRKNLEWLRGAVAQSALEILHLEGGWYAVVRVPRVRTEEEWVVELLRLHDVLIQPGFFYDFDSEAFLVVSLLTEDSVFREGILRLLVLAGIQ